MSWHFNIGCLSNDKGCFVPHPAPVKAWANLERLISMLDTSQSFSPLIPNTTIEHVKRSQNNQLSNHWRGHKGHRVNSLLCLQIRFGRLISIVLENPESAVASSAFFSGVFPPAFLLILGWRKLSDVRWVAYKGRRCNFTFFQFSSSAGQPCTE